MSGRLTCRVHPRPHQREAIEASAQALAHGGRGQVLMPCGTGKTLVGIGVAQQLDARLVLVVVPTLALIRQTATAWRDAYDDDLRLLFACSDDTLAEGEDTAPVSGADLVSQFGVVVSTNTETLSRILTHWRAGGEQCAVAFATYTSLQRALDAARLAETAFDLVVADEAHHCCGSWTSPWTALTRHGSHDNVPARRRLFLTATPRTSQHGGGTPGAAGMDDLAAFGPVLYRLSLSQAITRHLLADYQIAIVGTHTPLNAPTAGTTTGSEIGGRPRAPEVLARGEHGIHGAVQTPMLAASFALSRAMAHYSLRRIVTFHARVRDAQIYAAAAPRLLTRMPLSNAPSTITAAAVHAGMPPRRRAEILARFQHASPKHAVLASNVRCLAEGVDVPALDAVLFANPRRGLVDIIQAVGRVMRPHPTKTTGTVILPVIVPTGTRSLSRAMAGPAFADMLHVLQVLRDHDTELAAQLDELRRAAGRNTPLGGMLQATGGPLQLLLPHGLPPEFVRAFTLRLLAGTTVSWHERYGALQAWTNTHGHSTIPIATVEHGVRLGAWAHEQRSLKTRSLLPQSRVDALEQLAGWSWTPWEAAWERAYHRLLDYTATHGTSRVPQTYRVNGFSLGAWARAQRELHSKHRLPAARAQRLSALPGWYWRRTAKPAPTTYHQLPPPLAQD